MFVHGMEDMMMLMAMRSRSCFAVYRYLISIKKAFNLENRI